MSSMFDGVLIEYIVVSFFEMCCKFGKEVILMVWNVEERVRLWLEVWCLLLLGWYIFVFVDFIESLCLELFSM